jgi:chorismate mutase
LIHGVLSRESTEQSRGSSVIHGFFMGSCQRGDVMEHSVLEQARQALYASDERIVQLLTLRYHLASQLAHAGLSNGAPVSFEARVAAVVSRLTRSNPGPLDDQQLTSIFALVISLTEPLSTGLGARNDAAKKG